jgi:hypothetical protein
MKTIRISKLINCGVTDQDFPNNHPNDKVIIGTKEEILDSFTEEELASALKEIRFKKACEALDKAIAMFDMPIHVLYGDEALNYLQEESQ